MSRLYKLLVFLTFLIPTGAYTLINAIMVKPDYDLYVEVENPENVRVIKHMEGFKIYVIDGIAIDGVLHQDDNYGWAFTGDENSVIKINKDYYQYVDNKLEKQTIKLLKEKQGKTIPLSLLAIIIGGVIIGLIVYRKATKNNNKHWRVSVLVSLLVGTGLLFVLDLFISNIFYVFLTATISWVVYMVEHYFHNNKIILQELQARNKGGN